MIHTVNDFYNKLATEIRERFFPHVKYYRDDKNCEAVTYAIELFNNGCLTYRAFIGRLAKGCGTNNATIHNIVEKYIVSFGQYQYKPRKLYSQEKKQIF
jgi:hypothetical protein